MTIKFHCIAVSDFLAPHGADFAVNPDFSGLNGFFGFAARERKSCEFQQCVKFDEFSVYADSFGVPGNLLNP